VAIQTSVFNQETPFKIVKELVFLKNVYKYKSISNKYSSELLILKYLE